jgi:hypothetical protein
MPEIEKIIIETKIFRNYFLMLICPSQYYTSALLQFIYRRLYIMALVSAIAASFISALSEDHYPFEDIERLFGIQMGTEQGALMLCAWQTLYKHDGSVTAATISQALRSDTLTEAFQRLRHQSRGLGYTAELIARGLEFTSWMRMVEFKFV